MVSIERRPVLKFHCDCRIGDHLHQSPCKNRKSLVVLLKITRAMKFNCKPTGMIKLTRISLSLSLLNSVSRPHLWSGQLARSILPFLCLLSTLFCIICLTSFLTSPILGRTSGSTLVIAVNICSGPRLSRSLNRPPHLSGDFFTTHSGSNTVR